MKGKTKHMKEKLPALSLPMEDVLRALLQTPPPPSSKKAKASKGKKKKK
jgi:hypothetical protein